MIAPITDKKVRVYHNGYSFFHNDNWFCVSYYDGIWAINEFHYWDGRMSLIARYTN